MTDMLLLLVKYFELRLTYASGTIESFLAPLNYHDKYADFLTDQSFIACDDRDDPDQKGDEARGHTTIKSSSSVSLEVRPGIEGLGRLREGPNHSLSTFRGEARPRLGYHLSSFRALQTILPCGIKLKRQVFKFAGYTHLIRQTSTACQFSVLPYLVKMREPYISRTEQGPT